MHLYSTLHERDRISTELSKSIRLGGVSQVLPAACSFHMD